MNKGYGRYLVLIDRMDSFLQRVRRRYHDQILCERGGEDCCRQSLSGWPVEAFHLSQRWKALPANLASRLRGRGARLGWSCCLLLWKGECMLYSDRPIICRTFGFPALSKEEESFGHPLMSYCPRNFPGWQEGDRWDGEYILDLDALNRMLTGISLLFLGEPGKNPLLGGMRIPILDIIGERSQWEEKLGLRTSRCEGRAPISHHKHGGSDRDRRADLSPFPQAGLQMRSGLPSD